MVLISEANHITIYHARLGQELSRSHWNLLVRDLPKSLRESLQRYRFWQDKQRALYGKLLLQQALSDHRFTTDLSHLKYTAFQRPYLDDVPDFNISHAGDLVVCAMTIKGRIGIDIEQILPINFEEFNRVLSPLQWKEVHAADDPYHQFFRLWTIKESVIKANGKGLSIDLHCLETDYQQLCIENTCWDLTELQFDSNYCSCLATDFSNPAIKYVEVTF